MPAADPKPLTGLAQMSGAPDDWDVGSYPPYVTHRSGCGNGCASAGNRQMDSGGGGLTWK